MKQTGKFKSGQIWAAEDFQGANEAFQVAMFFSWINKVLQVSDISLQGNVFSILLGWEWDHYGAQRVSRTDKAQAVGLGGMQILIGIAWESVNLSTQCKTFI